MSDLILKFAKCSYYILDSKDEIVEKSDDYYENVRFSDKKLDFRHMVRSIGAIKFTRHFTIYKKDKLVVNEKGMPVIIDITIKKYGNGKIVHL